MLAFVAAHLLSLRVAADLEAGLWQLRTAVLEPFLLYLLVRSQGRNRKTLVALGDALVLGAVAVAAIGLYQFFFTDYVESVEGVRRILSVFDSPNHLSLFLGRAVPVAACVALWGGTRWRRLAHGVALLPLLLCLYLTFSRGAWLLGLPASLLCIGWLRGRKGMLIALGVIAGLLLALLPFVHTARLASLTTLQEGTTSFLRLLLWMGTWRMIRGHPLWGVGSGNFVSQYPRYMLPEAWREPVVYHPHNLVLETWAMLGVPGLIALAWLMVALFRGGLVLYRRLASQRDLQALILGLLAGMADMLAHGLVDTGYFLADLAFVLMLTAGIIQTAGASSPPGQSPQEGSHGCNKQTGAQPTRPLGGPQHYPCQQQPGSYHRPHQPVH
jgi:O-antigen ligase